MEILDLEAEFAKCVHTIQSLPKSGPVKVSQKDKLKYYGLYKQALNGPCTAEKPDMFDLAGGFKWKAWQDLGQMSSESAKQQYVTLCHESLAKLDPDVVAKFKPMTEGEKA